VESWRRKRTLAHTWLCEEEEEEEGDDNGDDDDDTLKVQGQRILDGAENSLAFFISRARMCTVGFVAQFVALQSIVVLEAVSATCPR
jgi:hypothetical protein